MVFHIRAQPSPAELRFQRFVVVNSPYLTENLISSLPFAPTRLKETNGLNAIYSYVKSGTAVAVLGQNQMLLGDNGIHTVPIPSEKKYGVDVLWNRGKETAELLSLVEHIAKVFEQE